MVRTDRLFELADRAGVVVEFYRLPAAVLGVYVCRPPLPPAIGLHTTLSGHERLLRCVLAEELGHHHASTGDQVAKPYRSYVGRVLLTRVEKRALAWAAGLLMPPAEVVDELRLGAGIEDLAEGFRVTPTFVRGALHLPTYAGLIALIVPGAVRDQA